MEILKLAFFIHLKNENIFNMHSSGEYTLQTKLFVNLFLRPKSNVRKSGVIQYEEYWRKLISSQI